MVVAEKAVSETSDNRHRFFPGHSTEVCSLEKYVTCLKPAIGEPIGLVGQVILTSHSRQIKLFPYYIFAKWTYDVHVRTACDNHVSYQFPILNYCCFNHHTPHPSRVEQLHFESTSVLLVKNTNITCHLK